MWDITWYNHRDKNYIQYIEVIIILVYIVEVISIFQNTDRISSER